MTDIWETRACASHGVIHGCATLFMAWKRNDSGTWEMCGSFWSRADAERAVA